MDCRKKRDFIGGIPIINTENACASSSTAFHVAWMYVASGMYDMALAVGMEKLYHEDKRRSFQAIGAAVDVDLVGQVHLGDGLDRLPVHGAGLLLRRRR